MSTVWFEMSVGLIRPLTIEELERWATFGATWRVVEISDRRAIVDMCQCTGELEARRVAIDPLVLEYLRNQPTSVV
jgi:hypothetical protein